LKKVLPAQVGKRDYYHHIVILIAVMYAGDKCLLRSAPQMAGSTTCFIYPWQKDCPTVFLYIGV
jgi:hypothetical protein